MPVSCTRLMRVCTKSLRCHEPFNRPVSCMNRPNLIVFSDDWGRHPSSCQHLVSHLLDRFEVTWVNTIGTRPPRISIDTFRRGCEKLRHWSLRRSEPTN